MNCDPFHYAYAHMIECVSINCSNDNNDNNINNDNKNIDNTNINKNINIDHWTRYYQPWAT